MVKYPADAQIKKGILELCVLQLIKELPTYGYEAIKTIRRHFPEVSESTIYAILRRLHIEKHADVLLCEDSGGSPRKYYVLTASGADLLESNKAS